MKKKNFNNRRKFFEGSLSYALHYRRTRVERAVCGEIEATTTIMTLSAVEISAQLWADGGDGGGIDGGVVCNGRALSHSGPQTERRCARRPSAPHDATTATRQRTTSRSPNIVSQNGKEKKKIEKNIRPESDHRV